MLTIGDNNNDIEMVQKAGYGFAMQNAIPALKKVAKFHARSNEEEGVLDVIDLVLQSKGFSEDLFVNPRRCLNAANFASSAAGRSDT